MRFGLFGSVTTSMSFIATVWVVCMASAAMAQGADSWSVPREIGNCANHFCYQPTPGEVIPREVLAGMRPSRAQQDATGRTLEAIDRSLLREEGLSEKNLPVFTPR
jgi:hypothetical protein